MLGPIVLGTQSWNFRDWVGPFYPPGTRSHDMLSFYSRVFRTIEVDATFYGLPAAPVLAGWRDQVPPGFQFALKVPQQITHEMRLVDVEDFLLRFVERVQTLGDALGPLLLQMSPDFHASAENRAVVGSFLTSLPSECRWAIEFRRPEWTTPETLEMLRSAAVALVLADGRWFRREHVTQLAAQPTASFAYVRWMGSGPGITDYSAREIDRRSDLASWADVLQGLRERVETVYGYFSNQFEGHGPSSARELQRLLGERPVEPAALHPQGDLFGPTSPE